MTKIKDRINDLNFEKKEFEEQNDIDRKKKELFVDKIGLPLTDSCFFPII